MEGHNILSSNFILLFLRFVWFSKHFHCGGCQELKRTDCMLKRIILMIHIGNGNVVIFTQEIRHNTEGLTGTQTVNSA